MLAFHVGISLVAIVLGFVVLGAMLGGKSAGGAHAAFLVTTILTSLTGFPLPAATVLPSHIVAVISLVLLAMALVARYGKSLEGRYRKIYAGTALAAFYFNLLVLVTQSFLHVPVLHAMAPNGNEPPFAVAQLALLIGFVLLAVKATRRFASLGQPI